MNKGSRRFMPGRRELHRRPTEQTMPEEKKRKIAKVGLEEKRSEASPEKMKSKKLDRNKQRHRFYRFPQKRRHSGKEVRTTFSIPNQA